MKVPLSWLKEFVDIKIPLIELASRLTLAGLEVEGIQLVGLPAPQDGYSEFSLQGLSWDPEKIVVAAISEVMPHPNADRLVLCRLDDGQQEHIVLTGAPNLFPYKGQGLLERPLKVAYAKEGAQIYDGHQPGQVLTTLKRAKIRGVDSYSMVCSEKELGISDEHEGVIILDDDAPTGMPLVDYLGDAVFEIAITPNLARDLNILGVAREVSALTGEPLKKTGDTIPLIANGPSIAGKASIEIRNPELNPRFVLGLIRDIQIRPSPYRVQLRLRLAGMRPINNIVDATNYAMLEIGEPLHAFDYDILARRAGGSAPSIITRTAEPGERLTTLDGVDRALNDFTVMVCDTAGPLSIAGVMGGAESEVSEDTRTILLEGAAWNFINIRRTAQTQKLMSEAAYRFSRGVHPAMAPRGVRRGLELMRQWAGGEVAAGMVDEYPLPAVDPVVEVTPADARRWLGIDLPADQIAEILSRLDFEVAVDGETVRAKTPDHRLDIGTGVIGMADLMEEVARIYGYDRIPETRLGDELPPQRGNRALEREEQIRDLLVGLGLQETATYRLTTPEREDRLLPEEATADDQPYVRLANPIASDRVVMRHSLLASQMEIVERNARLQERIAIFEIAPVYQVNEDQILPDEPLRLAIVLAGARELAGWQNTASGPMDFFDLKGILEGLFAGLHIEDVRYEPGEHSSFHPGKSAALSLGERPIGMMGEIHPLVREHFDLPAAPVLAADLDVQAIIEAIPDRYDVQPVAAFPPVLEDLAVVVDEALPAGQVAEVIRRAGGRLLVDLRLFDVYRSAQIGEGKKSLAYSLTYQALDRTLTDSEVAQVRQKIIRRLDQEIGAKLRS
ncbi:MAG TPA: phenylalanine--tRNA ligase subunit beta [Anaerolineaceae bacterium]|nr:phenylalanine--tRNA ligase subunit beta [Anaerolineaceae bacterium]